MALEIIESCVNCWACVPLCPNKAIYEAAPHFLIDADKCTECTGDFAEAQCVAVCPIEGAILDEIQRVPELLSWIQVAVDEQDRCLAKRRDRAEPGGLRRQVHVAPLVWHTFFGEHDRCTLHVRGQRVADQRQRRGA